MTKNAIKSLGAYLNGENVTNIAEIKEQLEAELRKSEEKAQANRNLYNEAHDAVINALTDKPMTIAELWEKVQNEVPAGFTKSKMQYAMREYWSNEIVKIEGKVNEYRKA